VVLDSAFERNRTLFFCFSEAGTGGNGTALARARLAADDSRLEQVSVIFSQKPKVASHQHFGCRIAEARDGNLFLTLGERFSRKEDAQKLDNHLGKVVRLTKDGAPAPGNPFASRPDACPRSGATATAIRRALPSRRTARCGSTNMGRRVATRSTCPSPAATTAGP
jgi:glucose/arabinose dehydrogenase